MNARRTARLVAPLLLLAVALVACGDDGETTSTAGSGDPGDGPNAEVVVQVTVGGGFVTPGTALSTVPEVTVLADGTVLTPGVVPAIYPGPAVTPIQAATVDLAAIDALVDKARSLGLLEGPLEFGQPGIADAPTTSVTIVADGVTHRHAAYALAFGEDARTPEPGTDDGGAVGVEGPGVSDDEAANRAALAEFVAAAQAVGVGDRIWTPAAYVVTVLGPATEDPTEPAQQPIDWPAATTPATEGDFPCTLVEGEDASALAAKLGRATTLTPWVIEGEQYSLAIRPLVPGDPGCP